MLALAFFLTLGLVNSNSYAAAASGKNNFMVFNSYDLIGAPVKDSHGELAGFVNEVMIDSSGRAFAIIKHGDYDIYGQSGVNTPVPIQELRVFKAKDGREAVALKTDMEHLDFAPYLDPNKRFDRRYEANIYEYYGLQPYWTQSGTAGKGGFMGLDSLDLMGAPFENSCGKVIGVVQEVLVDSAGRTFAIINHGDSDLYGSSGINTPVPIQELRVFKSKDGREAVALKADMEHLDFAPYLEPAKRFDRRFEAEIYEYYGLQPDWIQGGESPMVVSWSSWKAFDMVGAFIVEPNRYSLPIGRIDDVAINPLTGKIDSVLVYDIQGLGDKEIAIPFSDISKDGPMSFAYTPAEHMHRSDLELPYKAYQLLKLPPMPQGDYMFFKVLGAEVQGKRGQDAARISDFVINSDGHIVYAVVYDVGGKANRLAAVPFGTLSMKGGNLFALKTDSNRLLRTPAFKSQDAGSMKYANRVYQYYGLVPYWETE